MRFSFGLGLSVIPYMVFHHLRKIGGCKDRGVFQRMYFGRGRSVELFCNP